MHPAAELAYDLAVTPRHPADLLTACREGWNAHGYPLTYCSFFALNILGSTIAADPGPGQVNMVGIPHPPEEVLALMGSKERGGQTANAVGDFFSRATTAAATNTPPAPGPPLGQIDREFKGNAVFVFSYWTAWGLMTATTDGQDVEPLLANLRETLAAAAERGQSGR